tara:strand:+ start:69 stop:653 length:585 start_codon:yes stop_codon:yes gene_type:complete
MNPLPWLDSPSIGQTLLQHNQTARFDNVTHMINYVCKDNLMGPNGNGNYPMWDYVPICEFPFINKGWNHDGHPGFDDVVFNDCSITLSQAIDGYDSMCVMMVIFAFIPTLFSCIFLQMVNEKKKPKDKNKFWFMVKKPNITEQLLVLGVFLGIAHTVRCIDVLGYAGRLQIDTIYTCCTAFCISCPVHGTGELP